ncbi:MAG: type I-MYXAN CRISPR-associated protein Cas6/Cmx6 [Myxococcota bacterium]
MHLDVVFGVRGNAVPRDHGYALFSCLSRVLPELHSQNDWALHPIVSPDR